MSGRRMRITLVGMRARRILTTVPIAPWLGIGRYSWAIFQCSMFSNEVIGVTVANGNRLAHPCRPHPVKFYIVLSHFCDGDEIGKLTRSSTVALPPQRLYCSRTAAAAMASRRRSPGRSCPSTRKSIWARNPTRANCSGRSRDAGGGCGSRRNWYRTPKGSAIY